MRKQRLRGVEITGFKSHSLDVGAELGWLGVWLPPALHPGCSVPSLTSASVIIRGFPGGSEGKESACNARDLCSLPGLGRCPGEGNGNPVQYSCLENPTDREIWRATVHGVIESRTGLNRLILLCHYGLLSTQGSKPTQLCKWLDYTPNLRALPAKIEMA